MTFYPNFGPFNSKISTVEKQSWAPNATKDSSGDIFMSSIQFEINLDY